MSTSVLVVIIIAEFNFFFFFFFAALAVLCEQLSCEQLCGLSCLSGCGILVPPPGI